MPFTFLRSYGPFVNQSFVTIKHLNDILSCVVYRLQHSTAALRVFFCKHFAFQVALNFFQQIRYHCINVFIYYTNCWLGLGNFCCFRVKVRRRERQRKKEFSWLSFLQTWLERNKSFRPDNFLICNRTVPIHW